MLVNPNQIIIEPIHIVKHEMKYGINFFNLGSFYYDVQMENFKRSLSSGGMLLKLRGNPNIQNNNRITVLYIASAEGHHQVMELLLKRVDPNI